MLATKGLKDLTSDADELGLKRVKPGEKYTSNTLTLSLVKTALVMSKDGEMKGTRNVWSGPTWGSNREYKLSEDFDMFPAILDSKQ